MIRRPPRSTQSRSSAASDVYKRQGLIDGLVAKVAKEVLGKEVQLPLPRMTYDEAMRRFGHDAPDLRFGMELVDVSSVAKKTDFRVFRGTVDNGGFVRGINVKDAATKFSRRQIDALTEYVKQDFGAKGLAWFRVEDDGSLWSPIAKNFDEEHLAEVKTLMEAENGDLLLFLADTWEVTCKGLAGLRKRMATELELIDPDELNCSWVTAFPMFEKDAETGNWHAMHPVSYTHLTLPTIYSV